MTVHGSDQSRRSRWWLGALALAVLLLTLWGRLYPFDFQPRPHGQWLAARTGRINSVVNTLLLLPAALLAAWWGRAAANWGRLTVPIITIGAFALALGCETAQWWLPPRGSSWTDVWTNTLGALGGAALGVALSPALTRRWNRVAGLLSPRPWAQRALWGLIVVLLVKTYPFDLSLETWELHHALNRTAEAGWPLGRTWSWLTGDATARAAAGVELARAGANLALLAGLSVLIGRAGRESMERVFDRGRPTFFILVIGCPLALLLELAQWPIVSRVMDGTEAAAGLAGVAAGVGLDWLLGRAGTRTRAP